MGRSLMSSGKSAADILAARDGRQEALSRALSEGRQATVFLSLNIPGAEKTPPGSEELFRWALAEMLKGFPGTTMLENSSDALGHYAILAVSTAPIEVKKHCMALETRTPSARLIDLDVYSSKGEQVDRKSLGLPARPCLVCSQDAVECMRMQRHSFDEVIGKARELLTPFRP